MACRPVRAEDRREDQRQHGEEGDRQHDADAEGLAVRLSPWLYASSRSVLMLVTNLLMIQNPKKPTTIQKMTLPAVSMPLLNAFGKLTTSSSVNFFGSVETRLTKPAMIEIA